jgi:hypothetical protein
MAEIAISTEDWRTLPWRDYQRNVYRLQKRIYQAAPHSNGVNDSDLSTEEPCDAKVSRTVREWQGGGRPPP